MVDLQRMTATLWRHAEDEMRHTYGDPGVMARYIPFDKMDDYERARHQFIERCLHDLLDSLAQNVEGNLEEFKNHELPSCLRR